MGEEGRLHFVYLVPTVYCRWIEVMQIKLQLYNFVVSLCLRSVSDSSAAHARKSLTRANVVISGRGGGLTNGSLHNCKQLTMPSNAPQSIVNLAMSVKMPINASF